MFAARRGAAPADRVADSGRLSSSPPVPPRAAPRPPLTEQDGAPRVLCALRVRVGAARGDLCPSRRLRCPGEGAVERNAAGSSVSPPRLHGTDGLNTTPTDTTRLTSAESPQSLPRGLSLGLCKVPAQTSQVSAQSSHLSQHISLSSASSSVMHQQTLPANVANRPHYPTLVATTPCIMQFTSIT